MNVSFRVRNAEKIQKYLQTVKRGLLRVALNAVTEYIIGDERHGLRHDDPYKYVSRKSAYGDVSKDGAPAGYFSWAQFRFVMAKIASGEIVPGQRKNSPTQSSQAWSYRTTDNGYISIIENDAPSTYWIRSDEGQARQPARVGWRKVAQVVADNTAGAIRHARAAVAEFLRKNKP